MSTSERGFVLTVKQMMPERIWRLVTRPAAFLLRAAPDSLKYKFGLNARRKHSPYRLIEPGDCVFQIGAPSDLLSAGRSRAAMFLYLVRGGKLVVMEPDPENCRLLEDFARRAGLSDSLLVIPKGGWNEKTTLRFYASRAHPASAVLESLCQASPAEMKRRGYSIMEVPVTTVDAVIAEHGLPQPKLISATTNGAEEEILQGMETLLKTGPHYIALAIADDAYAELMPGLGYHHLADDDRGHTFERSA